MAKTINLNKTIFQRGYKDPAIVAIKHQSVDQDVNGDLQSNTWMEEKITTVGVMLADSLLYTSPGSRDDANTMYKKFQLSEKIEAAKDEIELSDDEIELCKEVVALKYPIFFVGQILNELNK